VAAPAAPAATPMPTFRISLPDCNGGFPPSFLLVCTAEQVPFASFPAADTGAEMFCYDPPKPVWEIFQLCRVGSKRLTICGSHRKTPRREPPSTRKGVFTMDRCECAYKTLETRAGDASVTCQSVPSR